MHWLRIILQGTRSNRMGIGARVTIRAGGTTQTASPRAGESYLSSNDPRLHFGLGKAVTADVEIVWPGGQIQRLQSVAANREYLIRQPEL